MESFSGHLGFILVQSWEHFGWGILIINGLGGELNNHEHFRQCQPVSCSALFEQEHSLFASVLRLGISVPAYRTSADSTECLQRSAPAQTVAFRFKKPTASSGSVSQRTAPFENSQLITEKRGKQNRWRNVDWGGKDPRCNIPAERFPPHPNPPPLAPPPTHK